MGDAYLRTGRGGAGNFYSQKDVEAVATKDGTEDLEAQKLPAHQDTAGTSPRTTPPASVATGAYARSGRGGAGNFVVPSSALPSTASSPPSSPPPSKSAQPPPGPSSSRYSGRGGAGNWAAADGESEGARRAKDDQDQRRKAALDAGIVQEIRASLPQPPRTYHLHEPGRGRRPEDDLVDA
ncbi:hypothetical protein F4823DRAFT_564292 [Ustulina deusta]|nr:hypothetical protein F4823DRAFT_564292 [Ustulina deusta]